MRAAHLAAAVVLLLIAGCASDASEATKDLPNTRSGYEAGVSYLLREQLDLELTDREDACFADAFVSKLDLASLSVTGLTASGLQDDPLFYKELGRVLDAQARSDVISGATKCLEPRCGSLVSGQRFGRDLVALLLADRDFHDETSVLLKAMSDGASKLPPVCDDGSSPSTTTTHSSRPDPVIACLPPGSTFEEASQLLRVIAPLSLELEFESAHAGTSGVSVEFAMGADPAERRSVIDALKEVPGVVDVRPLSEGCQ
jgi:hypothetical protein